MEEEMTKLKEKLNRAMDLLSEAHDVMDDVHLYDTELYNEISEFFEGDEE